MAFLRTLFWLVLTVVIIVFSARNWMVVTINLFGNLQADVKLPVLLILAFLLGFVPLYAWHRLFRWRDRQKRVAAERALAAVIAPVPPAAATSIDGLAPARAD